MNTRALIVAKTAAATSDPFTVPWEHPVAVIMHGTLAEDCTIQVKLADASWQTLLSSALQLTPTQNSLMLTSIGVYRVVKPITVGEVGVDTISNN